MRNLLLTLVLVCSSMHLFAQTETPVYKTTTAKFQSFYNSAQYDSIFYMYDEAMQKALPVEKTTELLQGLQLQTGKITKIQFIAYQPPFAVYKTNYERAILTLNISVDGNNKINGYNIVPYKDISLPVMERNITKMKLPFTGEWTVIWGGDTKDLNYHVVSPAQKNAFDILIKDDNNRSFKNSGQQNEDYYAFGQKLTAPCDGEIVMAVDGIKDNRPGEMNPMYTLGNSVIIKTDKNEFLYFAHFRQFSVKVKQGQKVKQGELLGLCGNSGNSSEPHVHFHIQNTEDSNAAIGVKCYFDQIIVNGQPKTDYSPVQNDKIKN